MTIRLAIAGASSSTDRSGAHSRPAPSCVDADGRIAAAGPSQSVPIPADTPTIRAEGKSVLPGLIDGHVHITWDKGLYTAYSAKDYTTRLLQRDPERQLVRAAHFAQLALAAGVTTLRDCGADDFTVLALRDAINAGQFVGPRILACGRPITTTAGHIYSDWGVDSADEIRKAVRSLAARGVDFIKLIASGGTTTPGTNITRSQYTLDEVRAAVEDAHRLGLPVAVHAISTDSIRLTAEAGVDTIEHCSWIGADPRTTVTDATAVDWMVKHGVRVDHAIIPRPYLFPDESARGPHAGGAVVAEHAQGALAVPAPHAGAGRDGLPGHGRRLRPLAGHRRLARLPGDGARRGESWCAGPASAPWTRCRWPPREAARALRLDAEIGTVEAGKRADLILLADDPLQDIRTLRQPEMVFRDGRLVARRGQIVLMNR